MDVRTSFVVAMGILLFTMYYLEKEMEKEQIFWLFSGLGVAFGLASVYTVAKNIASYENYITFAVLFVLIAILYYEGEEEKGEAKAKEAEEAEGKHRGKHKRRKAGKKKWSHV